MVVNKITMPAQPNMNVRRTFFNRKVISKIFAVPGARRSSGFRENQSPPSRTAFLTRQVGYHANF
jgi:hypothetical protein